MQKSAFVNRILQISAKKVKMLHNRIAQARNYAGFNQDEFAKKLGVGKRTLADYEKGISEPKATVAADIAEICNIDAWWLLTGKGSMMADTKTSELTQCEPSNSDMVGVPYYQDAYVSAGVGAINHYSETSILQISKTFVSSFFSLASFAGMEAVNIDGDSMEPELKSGDIALVATKEAVKEGAVFVVKYHGEHLIKRVQRNPKTGVIRLHSDNPKYDPYIIEGDDLNNLEIVGKVIGSISKTK